MSNPKVRRPDGPNGGDSMAVESGGHIEIKTGGKITGTRIERKAVQVNTTLVTATAASAIVAQIGGFEHAVGVKRISFMPNAASSGHATNNVKIAVHRKGSTGTAAVEVASLTLTTGNALVANVPKALTLATAQLAILANEGLVFHRTKNSGGITLPAGAVVVEYAVNPT